MAWNPYTRLGRPAEGYNVPTPAAYRAWQAAVIAQHRQARPRLAWRDPFVSSSPVTPIVNGGRWVVVCPDCGNAPLYDPEWQLACCPDCGAIYEQLVPPSDWQAIEAVLMARPALYQRNWTPRETLADLVAENAAHGVVPS